MQSVVVENTLAEVCCACLTTKIHLIKTTDSDANNIDIITKLRSCISEVTWTKGYICDHCLEILNQSYLFKELCIRTNQSLFLKDCQVVVKTEEISVSDNFSKKNDPECSNDELKDNNIGFCDRDSSYASIENNNLLIPTGICKDKFQKNIEELQLQNSSTEEIFFKKEEESDDSVAAEASIQKRKRQRGLTCEICNNFTGAYKKLVAHVATIHKVDPTTITPYKCNQCSMKYKTSSELSHHKIRHPARERPPKKRKLKCEMCFKMFLRNSHLTFHIQRKHTDPNLWEYSCSFCDQKYALKWDYENHIRQHTGDKPFACNLCDQKFTLKSVLQNHLTTHSDVRNFKCDYCDKEYKLKSTLKVHLKKVHNAVYTKVKQNYENACTL